jgi:hypothetical protein
VAHRFLIKVRRLSEKGRGQLIKCRAPNTTLS